jgi:ribosomal protein S12 methylthiotransferase accessory factor YcaO
LQHYRQCGIHVQFQDLTTELGVPCYKCFVVGSDGQIAKGTGAHPQGRRALLSALTETMYPYPNGPVSKPGLEALPMKIIEDLPDHSLGSDEADLERLERLSNANGFQVIYADLTREDLDLPVVRALVPGLALMADYDRFTRLNPRLIKRLVRCSNPVNG